jgi:hypothetical protein
MSVLTTVNGRRTTEDGLKIVMDGPSPRDQITPRCHMTLRRVSLFCQLMYDTHQGQLLTLTIDHFVCSTEWNTTVHARHPYMAPVVHRASHGVRPYRHDPQGQRGLHQGGKGGRQPRTSRFFSSLSSLFLSFSFLYSTISAVTSPSP